MAIQQKGRGKASIVLECEKEAMDSNQVKENAMDETLRRIAEKWLNCDLDKKGGQNPDLSFPAIKMALREAYLAGKREGGISFVHCVIKRSSDSGKRTSGKTLSYSQRWFVRYVIYGIRSEC